MEGFFYKDSGGPVEAKEIRVKEFVTGKAHMQVKSLGVVELEDGTVRIFHIRHDHNPHPRGFRVVGEAWDKSFGEVVDDLRTFEAQWITEELDERETYQ